MTKDIDTLITKHFPFPKFNPGQKEAIRFVIDSILDKKKHIVLQAPTGIGKSAIATTIHKVLKDYFPTRWRTTIITATKGLQDQYEQEDSDIYSLKGKKNYPCPIGRDYYTGPGCVVARAEGFCPTPNKICTYIKTRDRWAKSEDLRLTNTAFQVVAANGLTMGEESGANMVIVDECHELDESLVNHSTLLVDMTELEHLKKSTKKGFLDKFAEFISLFLNYDKGRPFKISPELHSECVIFLELIDNKLTELQAKATDTSDASLVGAIDELTALIDKIGLFAYQKGEWLVTEYEYGEKVEIKPVYAYQVSDYGLFRKAEHFLHMSATICGFEQYKETLGLEDDRTVYMEVSNPIPVENRKVIMIPKIKVSGDFDRGRLTSLIDSIINRQPNQNGVVHTVSFALAESILELSRYKDRMTISNNRDEILELLENNKNKILLSPSVEKGYDFKNDMCRFQILAKVPYGYLGDPWIKLNMERSSKWYARKTILRLVQASGRAVRGVNDFATTYIIDSNFERLLKNNVEIFPDWYLDSLTSL